MEHLDKLYKYLKKINELEYVIGILNWEISVNIPDDVISEINDLIYEYNIKLFKLKTSKKYGNLLKSIIESNNFKKVGKVEKIHIKKLYKEYNNLSCIPTNFYKKYLKVCAQANKYFNEAKEKNDANIVLPYLEKMVITIKELYSYRNSNKKVYDLLLDDFEEGVNQRLLDKYFEEIKNGIIPIIKNNQVKNCKHLKYQFTDKQLKDAAILLLTYIGFDFDKGDTVIYQDAFTSRLGFKDVRITFNNNSNPCLFASTAVHEGGHALVEANISSEYIKYANVTLKSRTALHESQSRFFENILGRNKNFWVPIYPEVKKILKLDLNIDEFVDGLNTIEPGLIRLDADEITYSMHIIIRYEIERDLFNGKISVYDISNIWNQKYKEYLGVDVLDDADGFLQDVHWGQGSFGYFPAYLLGNIYDGMLIDVVESELGPIDNLLKDGKIKSITNFLIDNIYKYGGSYSFDEILKNINGKKVSTENILNYFKKKSR